jgi:hypothetical protein
MKKTYKILFMLIGLFSIIFGFTQTGMGDVLLEVPERIQEHSQWCWAGTSQAVLEYYGPVVNQCDIANWAWSRSDCCGNSTFNWSHACNQPNYMYGTSGSLQGILAHWGVNSNASATYLSKPTVVSQLDAGRPFVMRFGWTSGGGHFLDGYGYVQNGDFLDYMDPWIGNGYTRSSYDWVVSAADHNWTHTLQITTDCPEPGLPVLSTPSNGVTGVSLGPTLDWSDVSGATSYDVRVCGDGGCSSTLRSASVASSQWTVFPALSDGTTYYWQVRANNSCGSSSWTGIWSYTTFLSSVVLQSPSHNQEFQTCSLITTHQPSFTWTTNGTFTGCSILFSTSDIDFSTRGVLINKATIRGAINSWTPSSFVWKKIMTASGQHGDVYWKVVATKPDRTTVQSGAWKLHIGPPRTVDISTPLPDSILPAGTPPVFNFDTNCNIKFKLEISSVGDFSDARKIKSFNYTVRDPNVETTLSKTLSSFQWTSVKKLVGADPGYFRIKAWDGIKRETIAGPYSFSID